MRRRVADHIGLIGLVFRDSDSVGRIGLKRIIALCGKGEIARLVGAQRHRAVIRSNELLADTDGGLRGEGLRGSIAVGGREGLGNERAQRAGDRAGLDFGLLLLGSKRIGVGRVRRNRSIHIDCGIPTAALIACIGGHSGRNGIAKHGLAILQGAHKGFILAARSIPSAVDNLICDGNGLRLGLRFGLGLGFVFFPSSYKRGVAGDLEGGIDFLAVPHPTGKGVALALGVRCGNKISSILEVILVIGRHTSDGASIRLIHAVIICHMIDGEGAVKVPRSIIAHPFQLVGRKQRLIQIRIVRMCGKGTSHNCGNFVGCICALINSILT